MRTKRGVVLAEPGLNFVAMSADFFAEGWRTSDGSHPGILGKYQIGDELISSVAFFGLSFEDEIQLRDTVDFAQTILIANGGAGEVSVSDSWSLFEGTDLLLPRPPEAHEGWSQGGSIVFGTAGADVILGDTGDDVLVAGFDLHTGREGEGSDVLLGGGGNDVLIARQRQVRSARRK